jgi:hypothetical protein
MGLFVKAIADILLCVGENLQISAYLRFSKKCEFWKREYNYIKPE